MRYKVLKEQFISRDCMVCGNHNRLSLRARFFECEDAQGEKVLITVAKPKWNHQSYPDRMHGGVVSAILDESIGRAVQMTHPEIWGVTIDLTVKFRSATPLSKKLFVKSKITEVGSRAFLGEGELFVKGGEKPLATASGRFFLIPDTKLDSVGMGCLDEENWHPSGLKLPKYIEF
ncbi:MAG: PaaI family thioesterase [Christensenellaceae bacterium]|jgi:acyl-coenzyme A thioesterase PaaI-like protein|nr:PaaI family thioesterase [Christensenellaceae bacterium]